MFIGEKKHFVTKTLGMAQAMSKEEFYKFKTLLFIRNSFYCPGISKLARDKCAPHQGLAGPLTRVRTSHQGDVKTLDSCVDWVPTNHSKRHHLNGH